MIDPNELAKLITAFNQAEKGAPDHLESYLLDNAEEISEKLKELDEITEKTATFERGIDEVQEIINNSSGVDGWHKNGSTAPWDDIFHGLPLVDWILEHGKEHEDAGAESEGDSTGDEPD